jgi:hypothetical protein
MFPGLSCASPSPPQRQGATVTCKTCGMEVARANQQLHRAECTGVRIPAVQVRCGPRECGRPIKYTCRVLDAAMWLSLSRLTPPRSPHTRTSRTVLRCVLAAYTAVQRLR